MSDEIIVKVERTLLTVGVDTLACTFGDYIYIAAHHYEVECPVCGAWCAAANKIFKCTCDAEFKAELKGRWAAVKTEDVCQLADRLFIPRVWNPDRPYIEASKLRAMYAQFCKERNECNQQVQHVQLE